MLSLALAVLSALGAQEPAPPALPPLRERAALVENWLSRRLDVLVPELMRREGIDLWILVAREYDEDPVVETMLPATWLRARRRTILVFHDAGPDMGVERFSISRYDVGSFFPGAWNPEEEPDQWKRLASLVTERDPNRIGIDKSRDFALADGLSASEYERLVAALPARLHERIAPAERLALGWLETRIPEELEFYPTLCRIAHEIIAQGFAAIEPGRTTTEELEWWYREQIVSRRLDTWFHPTVSVQRAELEEGALSFAKKKRAETIQPGDLVHLDFGITALRLNTDTQQHAYVLKEGETDAPAGLKAALAVGNRLQDILTASFALDRTGNEVLKTALETARAEGIEATIYSHPLGFHGHGAGPAIGMWDQQAGVAGAGDYPLHARTVYAIELAAAVPVPEWGGKKVQIKLEEDALFDGKGVRYLDGRQTELHLVGRREQ